jgi:hypothetical protein
MWLTDDEFTLGLLEIKPAPAKAGGIPASAAAAPSSTAAVEPSSNAGSGTTGVPTSSETVTTVADSKSVPSEPQAKGTVLSVKVAPVRNTVSTAKTSGSHEAKASVAPSRGSVPASRVAVEAPSHSGPPAQGAVGNIKLEDGSTKPLKTSNVESEVLAWTTQTLVCGSLSGSYIFFSPKVLGFLFMLFEQTQKLKTVVRISTMSFSLHRADDLMFEGQIQLLFLRF